MTVHQFGGHVRLGVLFLDILESVGLVPVQGRLDVLETGGLDVVDLVGEDDGILHCVHGTRTTTWEELVGSYGKE